MAADGAQLIIRLLRRNARLEAPNHRTDERYALVETNRERRPKLGAIGELEAPRHYSDHSARDAIERNGLAKDISVPVEPAAPQAFEVISQFAVELRFEFGFLANPPPPVHSASPSASRRMAATASESLAQLSDSALSWPRPFSVSR